MEPATEFTWISEPSVYLMAGMEFNRLNMMRFFRAEVPSNKWLPSPEAKDGEVSIEMAGRLCYMSFEAPRPGGTGVYLEHIKKVGHGSVLEHTNFSFIFSGISRSLSHELVRHRAGWAYSQLSQRYVVETTGRFVVPHEYQPYGASWDLLQDWKRQTELNQLDYLWFVERTLERLKARAYRKCQEGQKLSIQGKTSDEWWKDLPREDKTNLLKRARQASRSRLPNATETKIYATANVRAIRHFLEMRGAKDADSEIRALANKVLDTVRPLAPLLFEDYVQTQIEDSYPGDMAISTPYRKV